MTRSQSSKAHRINGLLIVNKPILLSSMGVVSRVRGRGRGVRTGHAGTLDPLATGVLVLGLGAATKQLDALMSLQKHYHTTIDLSMTTPCFDLEMDPEPVHVDEPPDRETVEHAVTGFVGDILQAPPAFSAIKIDGKKSYELARKQKHDDLPERPAQVQRISVLRFDWPEVELEIQCAKGFYVRALARDLGRVLGTGGVCTRIHRTAIGSFTDEIALNYDDIPDPLEQEHLLEWPTPGS